MIPFCHEICKADCVQNVPRNLRPHSESGVSLHLALRQRMTTYDTRAKVWPDSKYAAMGAFIFLR